MNYFDFYNNIDKIVEGFMKTIVGVIKKVGDKLTSFFDLFPNLVKVILSLIDTIKKFFINLINTIFKFIYDVIINKILGTIVNIIKELVSYPAKLMVWITTKSFKFIIHLATALISLALEIALDIGKEILKFITTGIPNAIVDTVFGVIPSWIPGVSSIKSALKGGIKALFTPGSTSISLDFDKDAILKAVTDAAKKAAEDVAKAAGDVVKKGAQTVSKGAQAIGKALGF